MQLQHELLQVKQKAAFLHKPSVNPAEPKQPGKLPIKVKKPTTNKVLLLSLVILLVISGIIYLLANAEKTAKVIGEYKVVASRAFFYDEADEGTKRNAYAAQGKSVIKAFDEENGFIYTEITNEKGELSKGWLRKKDLVLAKNSVLKQSVPKAVAVSAEVAAQLQTARQFLVENKMVEALIIFSQLSKQNNPEAMFQYGRLALQNRNNNISCKEAFDLLKRASDKGYVPAKRTLGFLYTFADDRAALTQRGYYERCTFSNNPSGTQLLMEAMLSGDTTAAALMDRLKNTVK